MTHPAAALTAPDPIELLAAQHRAALRKRCAIVRDEMADPSWGAAITPLPRAPREHPSCERLILQTLLLVAVMLVAVFAVPWLAKP